MPRRTLRRLLPLTRFTPLSEVFFFAIPWERAPIGHRKQIVLHREQCVRGRLQCHPVNPAGYLGIELVGLVAKFCQKTACLLGDKDALDAAVDRICLSKNEAGRFQTIDQRSHTNLADAELIGKLGLRKSVLARNECKYPPLPPCYSKRGHTAVNHHPPYPQNSLDEVPSSHTPAAPF